MESFCIFCMLFIFLFTTFAKIYLKAHVLLTFINLVYNYGLFKRSTGNVLCSQRP